MSANDWQPSKQRVGVSNNTAELQTPPLLFTFVQQLCVLLLLLFVVIVAALRNSFTIAETLYECGNNNKPTDRQIFFLFYTNFSSLMVVWIYIYISEVNICIMQEKCATFTRIPQFHKQAIAWRHILNKERWCTRSVMMQSSNARTS